MLYINEEKLKGFSLTKNNFAVLMDFDRTISTKDSLGSWSVLENPEFMNPEFKKQSQKLIDFYYPYELDYTIPDEIKFKYISQWYYKNMDYLYQYGLTQSILQNCVNNCNVEFHSGCKDFLNKMYLLNIPVIILSAGIGNVIVELLKQNDCLYPNINIISNFIKFENGNMLPFTDNIIHSSNKSIDLLPTDLKNNILSKDYFLLFGDLVEDLNMAKGIDASRVLSFGFLEKKVDENFEIYKNSFDVVLTNNSSYFDILPIIDSLVK
jgi:5'-nucleotidase